MCSKHVGVKNKNQYIEKNGGSRWSFTKNHYMMHGQQNVKFNFFVSNVRVSVFELFIS
jgi:hypothetical protein